MNKKPTKEEIEKGIKWSKVLVVLGSIVAIVRVIMLCARIFDKTPALYARPVGAYDIVGLLLCIALPLAGIYMYRYWKGHEESN